jgi:hypothetical protein
MLEKIGKYFQRVGIAISVLFNVILGGYSNQSFSARNYAWEREGKLNIVWLIDALFWLDPNHCMNCWLYWYTRKTLGEQHDNDIRSQQMRVVQEGEEAR